MESIVILVEEVKNKVERLNEQSTGEIVVRVKSNYLI